MKLEKDAQKTPAWRTLLVVSLVAIPPAVLLAGLAGYAAWSDPEPVAAPVAEVVLPPAEVVPAGPTPAELLVVSQNRVGVLEGELETRRAELAGIQAQGAKAKKESRQRIARLELLIAGLESELGIAGKERDDLRLRLDTAVAGQATEAAAHTETRAKVAIAEEVNSDNLWVAFTQQARLEMCQQVTKSGRVACGEKLEAWFDEGRQARFEACVSDARNVPLLWRRGHDEVELPSTAELVDVPFFGQKRDWYVLYCDPTLPEAQMAANNGPPPLFVPNPWK